MVFHPFRAMPGGSRTPKRSPRGRRSIESASRNDGKAQRQRRLVGLVSDRPTTTLLACADHCDPRPDSAVDKQAVKGSKESHRAARDAGELLEPMG